MNTKKSRHHIKNEEGSYKKDPGIQQIFKPGKKVDLVLYNRSHDPSVRTAMIYDCDYDSNYVIISQTNPLTFPSTKYRRLGLTILVNEGTGHKKRIGIPCKIMRFIKGYQVNENIRENAITLEYFDTIKEFNIREAYRFQPPSDCEVKGKIIHEGIEFHTEDDFKVQNISIGGVGLLVNHMKTGKRNPLLYIGVDKRLKTEFSLVNFDSMKYEKFIATVSSVVWKNNTYANIYGYMGAKFIKIGKKEEESLHQFIHNGQLRTIRKQHGY